MLTFSVNPSSKVIMAALGKVNWDAKTPLGKEWLSETFFNYMDNRVTDDVNVDAYAYNCQKNVDIAQSKRIMPLVTVQEYSDGVKGVTDAVASYTDKNIDDIVDDSEFSYIADQFMEMRGYIRREVGFDIWKVLKRARLGDKRAINKFRSLIDEFHISDLVYDLLSNKDCYEKLYRRMNVQELAE